MKRKAPEGQESLGYAEQRTTSLGAGDKWEQRQKKEFSSYVDSPCPAGPGLPASSQGIKGATAPKAGPSNALTA